MPPYAGPTTAARNGDVTETLRLMAYLVLSVVLIVLDHRGGWMHQARGQASLLVQPLLMVAGWPGRLAERLQEDAGTLAQLTQENRRLRSELLVNHARMARVTTVVADNVRLRGLLDAAQRGSLDVQLAPILDVDLDPTRQRLVLDAGSGDGVRTGQSVIDAGGLLGQVTEVTPMHANVLLLTDPDHAVPVAIARNGVRLVAYGSGRSDLLALASIPLSSDVKVGDLVVTSGLGGRFPPGFPVGTIISLHPDESRAFLMGDIRPAAQIDRGRDVLLLRSAPARESVAPAAEGAAPAAAGSPAVSAAGTASGAAVPAAAAPTAAAAAVASPVAVNPAFVRPNPTPTDAPAQRAAAAAASTPARTGAPGTSAASSSPARTGSEQRPVNPPGTRSARGRLADPSAPSGGRAVPRPASRPADAPTPPAGEGGR